MKNIYNKQALGTELDLLKVNGLNFDILKVQKLKLNKLSNIGNKMIVLIREKNSCQIEEN